MTEIPSPLPSPPIATPNQLRTTTTRLLTLLKTHHRAQIIAASLVVIGLSLLLSLLIGLRTKKQVTYQQPPLAIPSPSPRHQTRFANHPTIIHIEQELPDLEASISSQIIHNHPLLPPSLDMEVRIEK